MNNTGYGLQAFITLWGCYLLLISGSAHAIAGQTLTAPAPQASALLTSKKSLSISDYFLLLPDTAFSPLHPAPSTALRKQMLDNSSNGDNSAPLTASHFRYGIQMESSEYAADSYLAFSILPEDPEKTGSVYYTIKRLSSVHNTDLIVVSRTYPNRAIHAPEALFFSFDDRHWKDVTDQDLFGMSDLVLSDFADFSSFHPPKQLQKQPPMQVLLPPSGEIIHIALDRPSFYLAMDKTITNMSHEQFAAMYRAARHAKHIILAPSEGGFIQPEEIELTATFRDYRMDRNEHFIFAKDNLIFDFQGFEGFPQMNDRYRFADKQFKANAFLQGKTFNIRYIKTASPEHAGNARMFITYIERVE